jgi:hypothetical protein
VFDSNFGIAILEETNSLGQYDTLDGLENLVLLPLLQLATPPGFGLL